MKVDRSDFWFLLAVFSTFGFLAAMVMLALEIWLS